MSAQAIYSSCGASLIEQTLEGLCQDCLAKLALKREGERPREPQTVQADEEGSPERSESLERIGPYKLLQKIGEGGFGIVYMAEQEQPVRRRVALKVIKLGMDTRQVVARFEAERQALAMMDHPNIAKVLDAGATDAGRPYFVMELVKGIKITQYCDQNKVSLKERLGLFLQICHAIQHAHQKGIIHRDIKPSNIMLTMHDGVPIPKVIDFGIAKATEQRLTDKTLFTAYEQFMGTPAYMSPEQAEMSGLDVDTRSDIYSLGVLLYELLTGRPPFENQALLQRGVDEARRTIREIEPPRPSTRLNTLAKEELTTVARHRAAEPPRLVTLVRGDLDWIVMKCLEKDRTRRYETANSLALDIKRYLTQEPIVARPPSNLYRFGKLVRRNKAAFAGIAGVAAMLVLGTVVSSWQAIRASAAERHARERAQAEQQQRTVAEQALAQARIEEGKAWLERAHSYLEEKNPFYAKLMAARAIGFRGFGREKLTQAHREKFAELLPPGGVEAGEAELILRGTDDYIPIWHGPVARNADGSISRSATGVAFSPDGRRLASGIGSASIGFWDVVNGRLTATLEGHTAAVFAGAFSPDGRLYASASHDQTIRLWDVESGSSIATLEGYPGTVVLVAFSPDGQLLAACSEGQRTMRIWEVTNGALKIELGKDESKRFTSFAFNPDGSLLAATRPNGTVELWSIGDFRLQTSWEAHSTGVFDIAFSPDGRFLATGGMDTTVRLWTLPKGNLIKELQGHLSDLTSVQFSPNGDILASQDHTGVVRLWAIPEGRLKATFRPSAGRYFGRLAFSPDGSLLSSGGAMVQLWELTSGHHEFELTGHTKVVADVAISSEMALLVSGSKDGTVAFWELENDPPRPELIRHPDEIRSVAISPDGRWYASGCGDGFARICEVATHRLIAELRGIGSAIHSVAFSKDGKLFASASGDEARLWDIAKNNNLQPGAVLKHDGQAVLEVAFNPAGTLLATASGDRGNVRGSVTLWNVATGQPISPPLMPKARFVSVTFSPDGAFVAAGQNRGMINLWHVENGEMKAQWLGHSDAVQCLEFSSDGRFLASASADPTIALWDVATLKCLARLRGHAAGASSVIFTRDGQRLISGGEDSTIQIWNVPAALNRPLDYASFMDWFDLEGRTVSWKILNSNANTNVMLMKSFTGKSLVAVLQSGLPEDKLDRTLFQRFLRAGNLSSASLILSRHANWTEEPPVLGDAYLREAKIVLEYESFRLAAQHAARARTLLPAKAAQAWHITALAERGLKRWPEALAAVEQAIAGQESNADFWHDKAMILKAQEQKNSASKALQHAIALARKADEKDSRLGQWRQDLEQLNQ